VFNWKEKAYEPNTHWNYSSGTTNLLSYILRNQFKTHQEYLDFWYAALIDKIGMQSMIVETDMAGNYVGSSYGLQLEIGPSLACLFAQRKLEWRTIV
jgi:CubicO group peptidase (beta-lactamase class C family)